MATPRKVIQTFGPAQAHGLLPKYPVQLALLNPEDKLEIGVLITINPADIFDFSCWTKVHKDSEFIGMTLEQVQNDARIKYCVVSCAYEIE